MATIKLGENLEWSPFKLRNSIVKARRMREDFVFETKRGWGQGFKGQWLVEIMPGIRINMDDEAFHRTYKPLEREGDLK